MGAGTLVNDRPLGESHTALKSGRGFDLPLLVTVIALVIFGLVMMYSASWDYSLLQYGSPAYMFERQLMWLGVGLAGALALSLFDYHHWRKIIVPAMGLTILLLVAVLLMNEIRLGAKRALYEGSYQPSELAKLVTIVYLSVWLYAKREMLHDITLGLLPLGVILGVVGGLIYQQPDLERGRYSPDYGRPAVLSGWRRTQTNWRLAGRGRRGRLAGSANQPHGPRTHR